jgi:hypothetical protein
MWRVLAVVAVIGCGSERRSRTADAPAPPIEHRPEPPAGCTIAIDTPGGIRIDGVALPDLELETLRRVLGTPDRTEEIVSQQRYEERGLDGEQGSSMMVEVTDVHHVYDARGIVFHTVNGQSSSNQTPERIRVFFASPRDFDNQEAPAVIPTTRGPCQVEVNGHAIDPGADLRPAGVDYRTDGFDLLGARFGATSYMTVIDGLYTQGASPYLYFFLDAPATGRPSYLEIVPAPPP